MTHPNHVHPRSKRTAIAALYRPLHKPLALIKAGASQARKANTYRGHPDRAVQPKLRSWRKRFVDASKYTGEALREIRRIKGVGRPVAA